MCTVAVSKAITAVSSATSASEPEQEPDRSMTQARTRHATFGMVWNKVVASPLLKGYEAPRDDQGHRGIQDREGAPADHDRVGRPPRAGRRHRAICPALLRLSGVECRAPQREQAAR